MEEKRIVRRDHAVIWPVIAAARSVLIGCHISPDGDTVGSALAMRLALLRRGCTVTVCCKDPVPANLRMLPGAETVTTPAQVLASGERFDLLLPLDVSDDYRLGKAEDGRLFADLMKGICTHSALIDHHGTNPGWCEINEIDGEASANALILYDLFRWAGVPVDQEIAACLYAAISTDTGNYSQGNTTAEAFRVTAELMGTGFPLVDLNNRLFKLQEKAQMQLTARAVASMRLMGDGRLAVMRLSRKDFAECEALPEHASVIVNEGLRVIGARMSLLAREADDGIKMSLRALAPIRVDGVAGRFGGGGHAQAAGVTMQGGLDACTEKVAAAMLAVLEQESI